VVGGYHHQLHPWAGIDHVVRALPAVLYGFLLELLRRRFGREEAARETSSKGFRRRRLGAVNCAAPVHCPRDSPNMSVARVFGRNSQPGR
jgi:hypothetical protein